MLQAAVAFGGGLAIKNQFEDVTIPTLRRRELPESFKVTVRVLAAAVPGLEFPGFWSAQRPYLQLSLGAGGAAKETEFADYVANGTKSEVGACASECPWRFRDSLTFRAKQEDLQSSGGLKVQLHVRRDVTLGPLSMEMRPAAVAEGSLDLQGKVLPACMPERVDSAGPSSPRAKTWASPVVLVPLAHMRGSSNVLGMAKLGEVAATVALVFQLEIDPELLLAAMAPPRPVIQEAVKEAGLKAEQALDAGLDHVTRWLDSPSALSGLVRTDKAIEISWIPDFYEPIDAQKAVKRATDRARSGSTPPPPGDAVLSPELDPDGWVSHRGPDKRRYWHHRSLGPAPWESDAKGLEKSQASKTLPAGGAPARIGPFVSPEDSPEGWVSFRRADGRIFWHHLSLGPPPWERPEARSLFEASPAAAETCEDIAEEHRTPEDAVRAVARCPEASGIEARWRFGNFEGVGPSAPASQATQLNMTL